WTCKPNSVKRCRCDGHSSRPAIAGRLKRPTRKFGAPSRHAQGFFQGLRNGLRLLRPRVRLERASSRRSLTGPPRFLPYLVLLRVGFALPRTLLSGRCALTAPFHPYLGLNARGGMFSVALSVERA